MKSAIPVHMRAVPALDGRSAFQDKCDLLREVLFPPPEANSLPPQLKPPLADLHQEFSPVSQGEISRALSLSNRLAAPGYDRVNHKMLASLHDCAPDLLAHLFTSSVVVGHFPRCWKHATCVVLPKPNRDPVYA